MKRALLAIPLSALVLAGCTAAPAPESATPSPKSMEASPSTMEKKEGTMAKESPAMETKDIVATAMGVPDLSTLVAAVKAADLVTTLQGKGPFTVFAPTNGAFDKVPKATLDALLTPAKKADLTKILTYHVVAGNYSSTDLKEGLKLKTVQGQEITFTKKGEEWMVNNAAIEMADVATSNGMVHVIDTVIMPK